jgi:hypothetical protein
VAAWQADLARAREALREAQRRQKQQADKSHRQAEFEVGQQVLLSTKNLPLVHTSSQSPKLSPRFVGPFKIHSRVGPVAYELALPAVMQRIHPVFHVSLLRPFVEDAEYGRLPAVMPAPQVDARGQRWFEVETLLRHYPRKATSHKGVREYLVKWQGYPSWENTKEPAEQLHDDCPDEIVAYWRRQAAKQGRH